MYCFLSHIESSMLNTHHVYCFCLFWGVKGLMFTTDGRPVGEKVPGGTATVYSMPYWSTVRPVMAPASLPQADSGSCLLCLATTTSRDHSEASLEGVWLVEQLVVLPISLLVTGRSLFFGGRHAWLLSWTGFILLCGVPGSWKGSAYSLGCQRGFFVTGLHPSVLLAGVPTSELPVVLLSSCNKKQCPPHWLGSRPILQRSLAPPPDSGAAVTATTAIPSARATPHTLTLFLMVESCGST